MRAYTVPLSDNICIKMLCSRFMSLFRLPYVPAKLTAPDATCMQDMLADADVLRSNIRSMLDLHDLLLSDNNPFIVFSQSWD